MNGTKATAKPPAPLAYIRSFECSARHLSFTKAAIELGYTQAGVSNQVRALENYLGRKLFVRHARSLELTEIGEAFLPMLKESLDHIDFATNTVLSTSRHRSVAVSCPASLAENWLSRVIAAFSRDNPDIEILVHGTIWERTTGQLADIAITIRRDDDKPAGTQMWKDSLVLVCSPDFLDRMGGVSSPADLGRFPRIAIHGRQEFWAGMVAGLGIPFRSGGNAISADTSNIALELAANGAGFLATTLSLAEVYLRRKLLVEPFPVRVPSPWNYYMFDGANRKGSSVRQLREWLLAEAVAFEAELNAVTG